eukprot:TRINITY_DN11440_c0_g1_i5.p1 TRINITY_DN11440_c0_g1~~TRINITY_DN11440_c0_g1_i5.p1  ORF type:complete len:161 (+),score=30.58 TRINITY_DN11440_c0_g1_i5:90-572(+)
MRAMVITIGALYILWGIVAPEGAVFSLATHTEGFQGFLVRIAFLACRLSVGITLSFAIVYTCEMFPTRVRDHALAVVVACGCLSALVAPEIIALTKGSFIRMNIILGAALLALLPLINQLPDTYGKEIQDNLDDAEELAEPLLSPELPYHSPEQPYPISK